MYFCVAPESQATNAGCISMLTQWMQKLLIQLKLVGKEKNQPPVNTCLLNSSTELPQKQKIKVDRKIWHKPH